MLSLKTQPFFESLPLKVNRMFNIIEVYIHTFSAPTFVQAQTLTRSILF